MIPKHSSPVFVAAVTILAALLGCTEVRRVTGATWHEKCGWKAEDYFDDPQVVALCKAIEANDLKQIDRLVAAGADVNTQGEGKMTPLLWAYPDDKLVRFKRLLEHGANPNVIIESDFNTRGGMSAGDSVTHMACKTEFTGYFEAVFDHGGDVNLINSGKGNRSDTPLHITIKFGGVNRKSRIEMLLDRGADINYMNEGELTPPMQAVTWFGQYDIALLLLKSGADYRIYKPDSNSRLIHSVVAAANRQGSKYWTSEQRANYQELVKWLEAHGESADEARADIKRWTSWVGTPAEKAKLRRKEVAERKAREADEKKTGE